MKFINLYKSRVGIPESVSGHYIKFEGLDIAKSPDRRAFLQSVVDGLNKKGFDSSVAPVDISSNSDIILLNATKEEVPAVISKYSSLGPIVVETKIARKDVFERAWQNRVRTELKRRGFWKIGDRYIFEKDVIDKPNDFKRSFSVQAVLSSTYPSLFVDPRTRVMAPLEKEQLDLADSVGEESKVIVRVLPHWQRGILVGRVGKKAKDMEFPLGNRMYKTPDYWRIKHDIHFVKHEDEMLDVYVPAYEKTLPYPHPCVFRDFKYGTPLPENLKKKPNDRVLEAKNFVENYLGAINFLGQKVILDGPTTIANLGYQEFSFPPHSRFNVIVGDGKITTVNGLLSALRQYGPYAGRLDGKYLVLHCGDGNGMLRAFRSIERLYSQLNLGKLELLSKIGNNGFIDAGGESVADYTSAIAELRLHLKNLGERLIVIIVLPDIYSSEIYYKSRDKLFERIFGLEPVPAQAISNETVNTIIEGEKKAYSICVTMASQCYVKLGGTGAAVWILQDAADSAILGIPAGSSCYAYHDVSRRPKKKASATAYSAMTDSYGRYIATGTKPVGGEKLTPSIFYDILLEILQKVSMFNQRYPQVTKGKSFQLKRLVFAKDGVIRDDEAEMMEEVIFNGIPDERKEPIPSLLKKIPIFPKGLVIDIIGVNKTPNKRVFEKVHDGFDNVSEGTAATYSGDEGLLVACGSHIGTLQPLEISIKKHLCLNMEEISKPHISRILEEYYRLTFLNWASIFKQGKYALPQILTQNLGKNISAGVIVPDDMILL